MHKIDVFITDEYGICKQLTTMEVKDRHVKKTIEGIEESFRFRGILDRVSIKKWRFVSERIYEDGEGRYLAHNSKENHKRVIS